MKQTGIYRVLREAGGYGLLAGALAANLAEGYAKARIAFDGGLMLDAFIARDFSGAFGSFVAVLVFIALTATGIFVKDSLLGCYLEKGMVRLRKKTVLALGETNMSWLDGHHTGRLSARVTADLNALAGALRPVLIMGISIVLYNCVALAFMFVADWLLMLIVFAIVPVTSFIQWISSSPIKQYRKANQDAVGSLSSVVFDCFGSFESVKSLALEDEMKARFEAAQAKQVDAAIKETRVVAGLNLVSGIGRFLPQLVLFLVGGLFVVNGRMSFGQLTMFIALSSGVIRVVGNMGSLIANIRQLGVNAERIASLWNAPKERRGGNAAPSSNNGPALCFDNVTFAYAGNAHEGGAHESGAREVLSDVSFDVPRGSFVALVGESGSGKSTVMKLAVSLYEPSRGTIAALGRDVTEWDLAALRSRVAYVTQETYLFPGSLASNIALDAALDTAANNEPSGRLGECSRSVEQCVKAAELSAFVESLPRGLETDAGERGVLLSGGQRQRVAIARALYKKADILFLDEATSALDRATEEAVLRGILRMKERPTLVAITHNLANVRNADSIIVFRKGRICESGTHESLLAANGEYARLLARQGALS